MSHGLPPADGANLSKVWQQFLILYPTEKDCMEAICRKLEEVGISCSGCGSDCTGKRGQGERKFRCPNCRKELYVTAGTFFHRIRSPRAWLGAVWLWENGVIVSAADLARLAGVAGSTAQMILKKMAFPIECRMVADTVPSCLFKAVFRKRSRETPERAHPAAEQEAIERRSNPSAAGQLPGLKHPLGTSSSGDTCGSDADRRRDLSTEGHDRSDAPSLGVFNNHNADNEMVLSDRDRAVYRLLSQEPVSFDRLFEQLEMRIGELSATLTMMELDGIVVRLPGDRYILPPAPTPKEEHEHQILPAMRAAAAEFIACVGSVFQGISRKYLQNYLAIYSCLKDRVRWPPGSLLEACARFHYISYENILAFVSPVSVKLIS